MKNNDQNQIREARAQKLHRAMPTDILVMAKVVEQNNSKLSQRPRRRRRVDYVKKISNDPLVFNA